MTEQHQTSITLSVFSARNFYSSSLHLAPLPGFIRHSVSIPHTGIVRVHSQSEGSGSLVWVDGLAVQATRTRAFVDALRRGEIPKPLTHAGSLPAHVRVRYLSPTNIALSGRSLVSVLGLAQLLSDLLKSSNHRACATCKASLKMYASAAELTEEILAFHRDQGIDIRLCASAEALALWSEALGFRAQESPEEGSFIELDSLLAQAGNFERVRKVLDLAWAVPDMHVRCRSGQSVTAYAPQGYCVRCDKRAPSLSHRRLDVLLQRGIEESSHPELLLQVHGVTLMDLLTSPLVVLERSLLECKILPPELKDALWTLNLQGLSLGRTADTLSASALARVALVTAAINESNRESFTVLDVPSGLMSHGDTKRGDALLEHSTRCRAVIVLNHGEEHPRTTMRTSISLPPGESLGTLRLHGRGDGLHRETDLLRGSCYLIVPTGDAAGNPLASEISAAVSGKPSPHVTFSSLHPCEAHLIDIRLRLSNSKRVLAQEFGLYEPLTKLYASAIEARMRGLTPKDFNLSTRSKPNYICPECSGLGVTLEAIPDFERPEAHPCLVCSGMRFEAPIKEIDFRGRELWRILNSPFHEEAEVLRALPKINKVLSLLSLLKLDHLPIGMPTSLLSFSERRLAAIATGILSARASRPPVLVIEEPLAGLSAQQAEGVIELMSGHQLSKDVTWILLTHANNAYENCGLKRSQVISIS